MNNVEHKVEKGKLLISIDLSEATIKGAAPSKSGKTKLLASTGGAVKIPVNGHDISFALNVMLK